MEGTGVRSEETESENVVCLRVGKSAGEQVNRRWHRSRRRDGYRGVHPLNFWSRLSVPESPRIGYAPLVSRTKPWAKESPIEGWFPPVSGEHNGCNVVREVSGRPGNENRCREDQPVRSARVDAGCQIRSTQRAGELCLDSLPHRRKFKRIVHPPRDRTTT